MARHSSMEDSSSPASSLRTPSPEQAQPSRPFEIVTQNLVLSQNSLSLAQFLAPRIASPDPHIHSPTALCATDAVDVLNALPDHILKLTTTPAPPHDTDRLIETLPVPEQQTEASVTSPKQKSAVSPTLEASEEPIQQIEQCCLTWRAGQVRPYWLIIDEPKFGQLQGCALRIQLSPRILKVYSVDPVYPSPEDAQNACAEAALAEDVLDFIQHGDGRIEPVSVSDVPPKDADSSNNSYNSLLSVQAFYETLPQPLPETVDGKTAHDINGPSWLNTMIQSARGGMLNAKFIWTMDAKFGFHGCLLRLERPSECKSYLVDARFNKRAEAKAAVCLQAMSQGIGDYIRAVAGEVENKLPAETRKLVADIVYPTLLTEFRKVRPGSSPTFEWETDKDACGCTLTVELAPSPSPEQVRAYSVPIEYRNRNDAKTAVMFLAAQQGVIDFIRYRGQPPPTNYIPFDPYFASTADIPGRKRKGSGQGPSDMQTFDGLMTDPRQRKRSKHNGGKYWTAGPQGVLPYSPTWTAMGPYQRTPWAFPRAPCPAALGSVAGSAYVGPPASQTQPGLVLHGYTQAPAPFPPDHGAFVNGGDRLAYYAHGAPRPPPFAAPPAVRYPPYHAYYGIIAQGASGFTYPPYSHAAIPSAAPQYPQPYRMGPDTTPAQVSSGPTVAQGFVPYYAHFAQGTAAPLAIDSSMPTGPSATGTPSVPPTVAPAPSQISSPIDHTVKADTTPILSQPSTISLPSGSNDLQDDKTSAADTPPTVVPLTAPVTSVLSERNSLANLPESAVKSSDQGQPSTSTAKSLSV